MLLTHAIITLYCPLYVQNFWSIGKSSEVCDFVMQTYVIHIKFASLTQKATPLACGQQDVFVQQILSPL